MSAREPLGSPAEEAAKLFEAIQQSLAAGTATARADDPLAERDPEDVVPTARHAGPECRICPVCQALALLRGSRPEVYEHLAAAMLSLAAALRAAVESSEREWAAGGRPPVEHIDIG